MGFFGSSAAKESRAPQMGSKLEAETPPEDVDFKEFVQTMNTNGMQCLQQGQHDEALRFLSMAKEVASSDSHFLQMSNVDAYTREKLKAVTLNNLGCFYKDVGRLHLSL